MCYFTSELLIRFACAPLKRSFIARCSTLLDVLSIIHFVLQHTMPPGDIEYGPLNFVAWTLPSFSKVFDFEIYSQSTNFWLFLKCFVLDLFFLRRALNSIFQFQICRSKDHQSLKALACRFHFTLLKSFNRESQYIKYWKKITFQKHVSYSLFKMALIRRPL